jgi:hypothetical protein
MSDHTLPQPGRTRWQPLRLGLVELFRYDSEEFWFRDGHLLLRGNNGTGKSKVLSLTLPLLLDANLRSSRVEPDGDPGKKMAWNLLLGDAYERRTGYSWIEFGRLGDDGQPLFLTLGLGLHAVAARSHQVESWYFLAEGQGSGAPRIGGGLWLLSAQRQVLSRERLRETMATFGQPGAPAGHGQVFENAQAYRRAVDERLFQLGARRYDALLDTLIQLRQPQLSRRPDERALSAALTESLPPLPSELLADVAEALTQLEELRQALERTQRLHQAVQSFDQRWRIYAGMASRRQARVLRQAQTEFDKASHTRSQSQAALAAAQAQEIATQTRRDSASIMLAGARTRLETLLADPLNGDANRLQQASAHARQRDQELVAATADSLAAGQQASEKPACCSRPRRGRTRPLRAGCRRVTPPCHWRWPPVWAPRCPNTASTMPTRRPWPAPRLPPTRRRSSNCVPCRRGGVTTCCWCAAACWPMTRPWPIGSRCSRRWPSARPTPKTLRPR